MSILQNDAEASAQVCFFDLVDVDSIVADFAVLNVVESVDQVGDGCFTCTSRTNESDLLTWFCVQRKIMQNHFVFVITKAHIVETNVTF